GISAIYLNPVFDAPSSHKYDGASYHHIDPTFGPDPQGDRRLIAAETPHDPSTWVWTATDRLALELIRAAHNRGIRVIFDGVFNHMGLRSWAFLDVVKNQQKSPYRDWFRITSWDDPAAGTRFKYKGWEGHRELPEWRQDRNGIVSGPKEYIFAATRRWLDPSGKGQPEDGVDGWRLDVAYCIRHPFWKGWRRWVKGINPEAYLVAEVNYGFEGLKPYLQGDEFDAVMNYNFAFACAEYFIDEKKRITTTEFDRKLRELREAFPACVAYAQQNLFGSHDTNRIGSHIVNRDKWPYSHWSDYHRKSKASNPNYDTRKPTAEELRVQKLFAIFQMTYLGAPMIYYGDEAGMWGANDPDCRKPMVWEDMDYAPERYLPDGSIRETPDEVAFDRDLFAHYRKLIHIRNAAPALQLGDYETLLTDDANQIYAFSRTYENQRAVVVINNSDREQTTHLALGASGDPVDVLNGNQEVRLYKGKTTLRIGAKWARILIWQ
ncbi:MAG TPA: glycoside hydrolase family 13 protein, partial [Blastocatellia bacterium]|nr:glycoside hydrolase family 13 protein [Blastocatellia bacterium]